MDTVIDPIGALTLIGNAIPGFGAYVPAVAAYLALAGGVCVAITAAVPAPTTASPAWWLSTYRVINWCAGNFGHAKNAVTAGMTPAVSHAAEVSARLTAAAPELAVVADDVVAKAVILPGKP